MARQGPAGPPVRAVARRGSLRRRVRGGVETGADEVAAALRQGCLALPDPEPADLFANVYADPHPLLREEQDAYADYLAGFDEDS